VRTNGPSQHHARPASAGARIVDAFNKLARAPDQVHDLTEQTLFLAIRLGASAVNAGWEYPRWYATTSMATTSRIRTIQGTSPELLKPHDVAPHGSSSLGLGIGSCDRFVVTESLAVRKELAYTSFVPFCLGEKEVGFTFDVYQATFHGGFTDVHYA
jgi:hypothetical protein